MPVHDLGKGGPAGAEFIRGMRPILVAEGDAAEDEAVLRNPEMPAHEGGIRCQGRLRDARPPFAYRGAEIRCAKGDHVCTLLMEGHPFHGATFGTVGTVTLLVDLWIEGRLLPGHMHAAPR